MSKTPVRDMFIAEFKKAQSKAKPPTIKLLKSHVKPKPATIRVKGDYSTPQPVASLAQQYINARKLNDDELADYIFLQISYLD